MKPIFLVIVINAGSMYLLLHNTQNKPTLQQYQTVSVVKKAVLKKNKLNTCENKQDLLWRLLP